MSNTFSTTVGGQCAEYLVRSKLALMGYKSIRADSFYDLLLPHNMCRIEVKSATYRPINNSFTGGKGSYMFTLRGRQIRKDAFDYLVFVGFKHPDSENPLCDHDMFVIPHSALRIDDKGRVSKSFHYQFTDSDFERKRLGQNQRILLGKDRLDLLLPSNKSVFARMKYRFTKRMNNEYDMITREILARRTSVVSSKRAKRQHKNHLQREWYRKNRERLNKQRREAYRRRNDLS
mgnify:CR=1 FL=1